MHRLKCKIKHLSLTCTGVMQCIIYYKWGSQSFMLWMPRDILSSGNFINVYIHDCISILMYSEQCICMLRSCDMFSTLFCTDTSSDQECVLLILVCLNIGSFVSLN